MALGAESADVRKLVVVQGMSLALIGVAIGVAVAIKLASVTTDVLGASGRAMLEAVIAGGQDSEKLAEMSCGKQRNKIPD